MSSHLTARRQVPAENEQQSIPNTSYCDKLSNLLANIAGLKGKYFEYKKSLAGADKIKSKRDSAPIKKWQLWKRLHLTPVQEWFVLRAQCGINPTNPSGRQKFQRDAAQIGLPLHTGHEWCHHSRLLWSRMLWLAFSSRAALGYQMHFKIKVPVWTKKSFQAQCQWECITLWFLRKPLVCAALKTTSGRSNSCSITSRSAVPFLKTYCSSTYYASKK